MKNAINMKNPAEFYEIDLLRLLKEMWQKAWAIILAAVIGAGVAFSIAEFLITPKYEAEAVLYVSNSVSNKSSSISSEQLSVSQNLANTYIVILKSRSTLNAIIDKAGLSYDYKTLRSMVSAELASGTEVLTITVTDEDPEEAKLIANTIVEVLPDRFAEVLSGSSVRVVDYAELPTGKSSPNVIRFIEIGFLAGAFLACLVIFIQMMSDTLIHDEDYLMETYDIPLLASIPDLSSKKSGGGVLLLYHSDE